VTRAEIERFIAVQTQPGPASLVPEIRLHLAGEVTPLWQATEATLARHNVPPPYWAFAWPGGQALARQVLDHPETVRGTRVLDFAAGGGIAAIAAALSGATATAAEVDEVAAVAIVMNAALNAVAVEALTADVTARDPAAAARDWDVVLAGDVFYERPMAERVEPWLRGLARHGALVLVADPGRAYLPATGLDEVARYTVPTSRDLEDRESRETRVFRLSGAT
jgi:predicted nicotinamide N-methyase